MFTGDLDLLAARQDTDTLSAGLAMAAVWIRKYRQKVDEGKYSRH